MRIAGALLGLALATAGAAPASALSFGPPDCRAFDRGLRGAANAAVLEIVGVGETRRVGDDWITPVRAVVKQVVKGRDLRRDQTLAWDDRVSEQALELFGGGPPGYGEGIDRVAVVDAAGRVTLWAPVDFYRWNLRNCYRPARSSAAG